MIRSSDDRGLRAFVSDYPEARPIGVYRGDREVQQNGVQWMPAQLFLQRLVDRLTLLATSGST